MTLPFFQLSCQLWFFLLVFSNLKLLDHYILISTVFKMKRNLQHPQFWEVTSTRVQFYYCLFLAISSPAMVITYPCRPAHITYLPPPVVQACCGVKVQS